MRRLNACIDFFITSFENYVRFPLAAMAAAAAAGSEAATATQCSSGRISLIGADVKAPHVGHDEELRALLSASQPRKRFKAQSADRVPHSARRVSGVVSRAKILQVHLGRGGGNEYEIVHIDGGQEHLCKQCFGPIILGKRTYRMTPIRAVRCVLKALECYSNGCQIDSSSNANLESPNAAAMNEAPGKKNGQGERERNRTRPDRRPAVLFPS